MIESLEPAASLLTTADVARRLNMSKGTLDKWRHYGTPGAPPFIKIGAAVRYEAAALEQWLRTRTMGGAP